MIYRLRRRHRFQALLAAIAAPALFFVALNARSPIVTDSTPLVARNNPAVGAVLLGENLIRVGQTNLRAAVFEETSADTTWILLLTAAANQDNPGPDLLVYWQQNIDPRQLASDATLLGPLLTNGLPGGENRFALPAARAAGHIVLYSLAHQDVVATSSLQSLIEEP